MSSEGLASLRKTAAFMDEGRDCVETTVSGNRLLIKEARQTPERLVKSDDHQSLA
jgi:hypothetical protein